MQPYQLASIVSFLAAAFSQSPFDPQTRSKPEIVGPAFQFADFDGDGLVDVFALSPAQGDRLLRNRGDGSFEDVSVRVGLGDVRGSRLALWADYDADGALDLYVGAREGQSRLFHNEASHFVDVTALAGVAHASGDDLFARFFDYDGDQRLDLHVTTSGGDQLFHNLGLGAFEPVDLGFAGAVIDMVVPPTPADPARLARAKSTSNASAAGALDPSSNTSGPLALAICADQILVGGNCVSTASVSLLGPTIEGPEITDGSIGSADLADASITQAKLNSGSVNSVKILNNSIRSIDIMDGEVDTFDIKDSAILTDDIADGTIKFSDLGQNGATPGQVIKWSGSDWAPATDNAGGGSSQWLSNASTLYYNGGKVGLGTSGAQDHLHLSSPDATVRIRNTNDAVGTFVGDTWGALQLGMFNPTAAQIGAIPANTKQAMFGMNQDGLVGSLSSSFGPQSWRNLLDDGAGNLMVDAAGQNGGTLTKALIFGNTSGVNSGEGIASNRNTAVNQWGLDLYTNFMPRVSIANQGNVGIGTTNPVELLDVNGATRTKCVKITGGCDLAEPFEFVERGVEPGMLMSIDPELEGKLRIATRAYDTSVAGVISGAGGVKAGMTLSQENVLDEGEMVALAGRVYCWCDASYGEIRPGDLLTSSETAGHAMKVLDRERAGGAIVGKALTSLSEGRGLVLIVVSLQ